MKKSPEIIENAVGVVVVNPHGEVLLAKGKKWTGLYTIPGGHIEYGENVAEAVRRELKEEIGFVPERIELLSIDEDVFPKDFHRKVHFIYHNFVGLMTSEQRVKLLKREFSDYQWISPHDILEDMPVKESARKVIEQYIEKYLIDKSDYNVVRVGVQAIVVDDKNHILLGQRKNIFGHGQWGLPGGHLEVDESIEKCAARELKEEVGVNAQPSNVKIINLSSTRSSNQNHHIQIGCEIEKWRGTPKICEPAKCSQLKFFSLNRLPKKLFSSSKPVIAKYKRGVFY